MKAIPIGDRILVLPEPKETKIGVLLLPEQGQQDSVFGTVVAVGPGKDRIGMQCKEGDKIMFSMFSGQSVTIDGVEHKIMREGDVFCIFPSA